MKVNTIRIILPKSNHEENEIAEKYFDNLKHVLGSPSDNSFSLKLLYYLDYLYLKRKK